jgi:hypothetical protein
MLSRSELPENPVVFAVQDKDGRKYTVTTERVRGGRIRMTCTCHASRTEGWCRHQVALLCLRYDDVVERGDSSEFHFEDIVMGTPLADTADEVDVATEEYERALKAMDESRPKGLDSESLQILSERAGDLADAATQLAKAVDRLKKRLASGAALVADGGTRFAA